MPVFKGDDFVPMTGAIWLKGKAFRGRQVILTLAQCKQPAPTRKPKRLALGRY
jgi:hypothetical protein